MLTHLAAAIGSLLGTVLLRLLTIVSWYLIMPPPKGNFEIWSWHLTEDTFVYLMPGAWGMMIGAAAGTAVFLFRCNPRSYAGWLCVACGCLISTFLSWRLVLGNLDGFSYSSNVTLLDNWILRDTLLFVLLLPLVCALALLLVGTFILRATTQQAS